MSLDLKYKAIFENTVDAIVIINQRGIIENTNPATSQLFGYTFEELLGNNVNLLMPNPHAKNHDGYIKKYLDTGKKNIMGVGRQVYGKKKDGSTFPIRLAVSEIKYEGKISFVGIIHDQSQIVKAKHEIKLINANLEKTIEDKTKELLQLLEREKELNDLKSKFVSLVSHEFRTPLSTILSSTSIIGRYTETNDNFSKVENHIIKIKKSIKNLNAILSDLLTLTHFDEGKVAEESEWFDLHELFEEIKSQYNFMLGGEQEVCVCTSPGEIHLYTQRHFLKNILSNLISNSIKFLGEGKTIKCEAEIKGDFILIKIIDTGIGIPIEAQAKLFERFYRGPNVKNIEGTGLGLNIVQKYLELIKGDISFTSSQKGTTFTISLSNKKQRK